MSGPHRTQLDIDIEVTQRALALLQEAVSLGRFCATHRAEKPDVVRRIMAGPARRVTPPDLLDGDGI